LKVENTLLRFERLLHCFLRLPIQRNGSKMSAL
jgi:hypothetical protein